VHDDITIPDYSDETLLRAGFSAEPADGVVLLKALGAARSRSRILALRGLVRHEAVDETIWLRCLDDEDVDVRREALTQVSQHPPTTAIAQRVTTLLGDPDALVVDGAAFALGEFLYPGAVDALCRVARDHEDARCREAAIAALGAIGDDAAREVIIAALEDKPPVRRRAIVALANFEGPDIDAALERASEDRDWQVRAAVSQLGRDDESDA
jgi:HEAT repeat protein